MCCPSLPVMSPHCDVRPRGGGNGKDSHKDGQAAVDQAGAKYAERGLGYQLLLWRLDPKGCGNSASRDMLSFPGPPPQELPFAAVSRGFPHAQLMCGGHQPFSQGFFFLSRTSIHRGSALRLHGHEYFSGTSKLGQQLSHVVLCLPGEAGCMVPATSRQDCKGTK